MTDIIDVDTFMRHRPQVPILIDNEKIRQLFALDCFTEMVLAATAPAKHVSSTFNKSRHVHQNTGQGRGEQSHRPLLKAASKTLSYHDKLMREVTGNINKINTCNLPTIVKKIVRIIDAHNISEVATIIMDKSVVHATYMHQLVEMLLTLPTSFQPAIATVMTKFAGDFLCGQDKEKYIKALLALDYENYDDYCRFVKLKDMFINKSVLVGQLINSGHLTMPPCELFDVLIHQFIDNKDNSHLQVMLLEALDKYFNTFGTTEKMSLSLLVEQVEDLELTGKARFIYQDIIEKMTASLPFREAIRRR